MLDLEDGSIYHPSPTTDAGSHTSGSDHSPLSSPPPSPYRGNTAEPWSLKDGTDLEDDPPRQLQKVLVLLHDQRGSNQAQVRGLILSLDVNEDSRGGAVKATELVDKLQMTAEAIIRTLLINFIYQCFC